MPKDTIKTVQFSLNTRNVNIDEEIFVDELVTFKQDRTTIVALGTEAILATTAGHLHHSAIELDRRVDWEIVKELSGRIYLIAREKR